MIDVQKIGASVMDLKLILKVSSEQKATFEHSWHFQSISTATIRSMGLVW
jgi:hypothetical protein